MIKKRTIAAALLAAFSSNAALAENGTFQPSVMASLDHIVVANTCLPKRDCHITITQVTITQLENTLYQFNATTASGTRLQAASHFYRKLNSEIEPNKRPLHEFPSLVFGSRG